MVSHWMIEGHTAPKPNVVYNLITTGSPETTVTTSAAREKKEAKPSFDSRTSTSYDAASLMSEKERENASWKKDQEKKESKLSKLRKGKSIFVFASQHFHLTCSSAIKKNESAKPSSKN